MKFPDKEYIIDIPSVGKRLDTLTGRKRDPVTKKY